MKTINENYIGLELPLKDKDGINIKIGDRLTIYFGTPLNGVKMKHENVEVYFNIETLQVCVRSGNITSNCFPNSLTGYVNPEYKILTN